MAGYQIPGAILQDGHSTTRPPYFNADTENKEDAETSTIDLESHDITKEQQETLQIHAKEIALLYCAVSGEEYAKISNCDTAKEMWDKIEVTYEGTSKVRETKIDALRHDYEAFMMKDDENIKSMFTRFSKIIGELKSLRVTCTNSQQVRKLVRSLPKTWETKAIVLEDGNLDKFTYDELRGNLIAFEKNHIQRYQKDEKKKMVAFKAQVEESDDDFKEEEVAMISSHVIEAMRRSRNNRKGSSNFRKDEESEEGENVCFIALEGSSKEHHKKKKKGKWYLDSACSRHMTGDKSLFKSVADFNGGLVTFGDNSTGTVIGIGTITFDNSCDISNVWLVKGLKYNLLSVSQLCDSDLEIRFSKSGCVIEDSSGIKILPGSRNKNVYTLDSVKNPKGHICLASMGEDP
ncbi:uncharacterized protein LOC132607904 [Lycium barbarum]|uniref:uncharacterized protein LOC132607904 n=1 Tax=Lycium barbarum TaxID=112863 RepID=UPI00293E3FAC|nr:uncharacterized protein LOC132607904 [Lycium barbarum]